MLGFIFICFQISFFAVSRDDFCIITNGKYTVPQLININNINIVLTFKTTHQNLMLLG